MLQNYCSWFNWKAAVEVHYQLNYALPEIIISSRCKAFSGQHFLEIPIAASDQLPFTQGRALHYYYIDYLCRYSLKKLQLICNLPYRWVFVPHWNNGVTYVSISVRVSNADAGGFWRSAKNLTALRGHSHNKLT